MDDPEVAYPRASNTRAPASESRRERRDYVDIDLAGSPAGTCVLALVPAHVPQTCTLTRPPFGFGVSKTCATDRYLSRNRLYAGRRWIVSGAPVGMGLIAL